MSVLYAMSYDAPLKTISTTNLIALQLQSCIKQKYVQNTPFCALNLE